MRLSGTDVRPFLQDLLTQDIDLLAPGQPIHAGLLSPQGKALFQLFLFMDGADILIDAPAADLAALQQRLTLFRLRRAVDIAPDPALAVWQQWGEASDQPADPRLAAAGHRFVTSATTDADDADLWHDWHQHRLLLGLPDVDEIGRDDLLWLETNAHELNGVSFTKGCYTGQENTARMHHRQRLRKRLLPLRLLPASLPPLPAGTAIFAGDRNVGELRGRRHGDLQMGLLRLAALDAAELRIEDQPVAWLRPPWLPKADGQKAEPPEAGFI